MPQHRKPTHSPKVLAAAMGVAATVSGVAFAQVGHEQLRSAPEPTTAASSPAAPGSSATDVAEAPDLRDLRPSRSAPTRRADLNEKEGKRRSAEKRRKPSPSPTETSTPTPSPEPATPAPEPTADTQASAPDAGTSSSGGGILGGTNSARANAGLPALDVDSCLAGMAQRHAERLAAAGRLYHQELGAVMSSCGMSTAGENVAMNFSRPSDMVGQWLDSPGHRANMLNRGFTLIGIGVAQARDGAWYGVQVFGAR